MTAFAAPIAEQIWDMKYRLKDADGVPVDGSVQDTWARIARAVAEVEAEPGVWEPKFYAALEDFKFLPAGRITAGAGTGRSSGGNRRGCLGVFRRNCAHRLCRYGGHVGGLDAIAL